MGPGEAIFFEVCAHHGGEQPGADDLVGLRAHVHGKYTREQIGIAFPATGDLRGERTGGPGIHDIRITHESTGNAPLGFGVTNRCIAARIDGKEVFAGNDR